MTQKYRYAMQRSLNGKVTNEMLVEERKKKNLGD
jgi:hypothetical protein